MSKPKTEVIDAQDVRSGDTIRWQKTFDSYVHEAVNTEWGAYLLHEWRNPTIGGPNRAVLPFKFKLERYLK